MVLAHTVALSCQYPPPPRFPLALRYNLNSEASPKALHYHSSLLLASYPFAPHAPVTPEDSQFPVMPSSLLSPSCHPPAWNVPFSPPHLLVLCSSFRPHHNADSSGSQLSGLPGWTSAPLYFWVLLPTPPPSPPTMFSSEGKRHVCFVPSSSYMLRHQCGAWHMDGPQ